MTKAKATKRTPQKSFIMTLGIILLIGSLVITFIGLRLNVNEYQGKLAEKKAEEQQVVAEKERKEAMLESDDKSSYIEQVARENGYVMPDEKVFYEVTPGA